MAKITGSAFRITGIDRSSYHHCTLLIDSNLDNLEDYLKPTQKEGIAVRALSTYLLTRFDLIVKRHRECARSSRVAKGIADCGSYTYNTNPCKEVDDAITTEVAMGSISEAFCEHYKMVTAENIEVYTLLPSAYPSHALNTD